MISIPLIGWLLIVGASVLVAFWSPARVLAVALGASWLMSLGAFYFMPIEMRPTANTVIDAGMFMLALSQVRRAPLTAMAVAYLSTVLIAAHFAFAWTGLPAQRVYEDIVNLLFIMECVVIGGVGLGHVVGHWTDRLLSRPDRLCDGADKGGRHGA